MLKDCMEIFEERLKKYREEDSSRDEISFITDSYVLADGTYILMDIETGEVIKTLDVDKNTEKNSDYKDFAKKDYLSKIVGSCKPIIFELKKISSNNYLSFIVRKETIQKSKLSEEDVNKYYEVLENPLLKYADKDVKNLYLSYENKNGKPNKELLLKCKNNVQKFLFKDNEQNKQYVKGNKDSKLKIFFKVDDEEYIKEYKRYIYLNVFNSNEYNELNNETIYGLHYDNMGMNAKKPFLENKNRKVEVPYYLSHENTLSQKLFFDFLFNLVSDGIYHLYITNDDNVTTYTKDKTKNKTVILTPTKTIFCGTVLDISNGCYLRISKSTTNKNKTECEIHDFVQISNIKDFIKFEIENVLKVTSNDNFEPTLNYGKNTSKTVLWEQINTVLYSNWLKSNLFNDAKSIKCAAFLKNQILKSRQAWIDWYYKGQDRIIKKNIEKYCDEIIKNTILYGSYFKACEQYNLKFALVNYFNNKELKMSGKFKNIVESLEEKINSDEDLYIETSDEFYFAIGQLINYFNILKKSDKKTHVIIKPFFKAKSIDALKKELLKLFEKYSYDESMNSKRFNNLYRMITDYETDDKIDNNIITGGYLSQSLIYKKNED